ncbi:MAG TPA: trypsin-like serine protease [Trebonia sp.]|nr:trypsin-like serine protease [Trebonia sp.]
MRLRARPARARSRSSGRARRRRHLVLGVCAVAGAMAVLTAAAPGHAPATDLARQVDASFTRTAASAPSATSFGGTSAVGALFSAGSVGGSTAGLDTSGGHFCSASVVSSPAGDLAITAAHCVAGRTTPVVFVPGYHDGQAPYGSWLVTRVFTDAAWTASGSTDDDVAFLRLAPAAGGVPVQSVTGAEQLQTGASQRDLVTVIGYPDGAAEPVTCENWTKAFGSTQLEFDCGGYTDGTSGSPFLAGVNPATGRGTVIGVIGGYEQGGDTPQVSYSIVFGTNVASLYQTAVAGS